MGEQQDSVCAASPDSRSILVSVHKLWVFLLHCLLDPLRCKHSAYPSQINQGLTSA